MKKSDLRKRVEEYQTLTAKIAELEKQREAVAEKIKRHMGDRQEEKVDDCIIRYQEITSKRFDGKTFQEAHADLYRQYLHPCTTRRFTVTA